MTTPSPWLVGPRRRRGPVPWGAEAPARPRVRLRGQVARFGAALLNQQLWCLGADIEACVGNLLLERGFERRRPPTGAQGSTAYVLRAADHAVAVWGFGVWFAEPGLGSLVVRRYTFQPRIAAMEQPPADAHAPAALGAWRRPRTPADWEATQGLLAGLCRWFGAYERWLGTVAPGGHRAEALRAWDDAVVVADVMPAAWERLAARLGHLSGAPDPPREADDRRAGIRG